MKFKKAPKKEECDCLPGTGVSDEEFASFCKTPEWIKRLPGGCITDPTGLVLYVNGAGVSSDNPALTRDEYKSRFGFDPKPVWDRMKKQKIIVVGNHL